MSSGKMKGRKWPRILDPGGLVSVCLKTPGTYFSMLLQLALVSGQNRTTGSGGVGGYMEREGDRHSALVVCMYHILTHSSHHVQLHDHTHHMSQ